jgi:hypothetical protein
VWAVWRCARGPPRTNVLQCRAPTSPLRPRLLPSAAIGTAGTSLAAHWARRGADAHSLAGVYSDLEPLVLNDPLARRAVLDFVKADANCSGGLTLDGAPGCCFHG